MRRNPPPPNWLGHSPQSWLREVFLMLPEGNPAEFPEELEHVLQSRLSVK